MMRRTSTLLVSALLITALMPSSAAPSDLSATASSFTVTARIRPQEIVLGEKAVLSGTVAPVRTATKVKIQRKKPEGWVTVAERSMDEEGAYRHVLNPAKVGTYVYRVRMPKVGSIAAGTSPAKALSVIADDIVEFTIPPGTGSNSWNASENPVTAEVGQTLRITNGDSTSHLPHADGAPFPHPNVTVPIGPGQVVDYALQEPFTGGSLYCHIHGSTSRFWLTVTAPPA